MKDLYLIKQRLNSAEVLKHNPIYDTSMYWSQKSFSIANILIEEFTQENDIIFDPFMGSGVSIIESVSDKNKRNAIGSEINEVPIFITKMALKKMTPEVLPRLESLLDEIERNYLSLYETRCPDCNSVGIINKIIFDKSNKSLKIKNINFKCSNPNCKCTNKNASKEDLSKMIMHYDIQEIKDKALIYNSKIAVSEGMKISDIFTPRNFKALDCILHLKKTKYRDIQEIIDYILLSMIHLCKITDTHSNSQWPLWTPKINCVEKNVFQILSRKIKKLSTFIKYKNDNFSLCEEGNPFLDKTIYSKYNIINKGTQNILESDIPDNSIDFILTDPPYLGQVLYSEYMQLYEPFLPFKKNITDEIVVTSAPSRNIKEKDYFELLEKAFSVCGKKLKNLHYMAMYFHDCDLTVWNNLIKILEKCNFQYISQIHIDKTVTLKNIISPKKSLNGDAILFFIKVDKLERLAERTEWSTEIETNIYLEAKKMLSIRPLSTPELYDNGLMEIIIQNGWLNILSTKYKSLVELFEKYFIWDKNTAKWTL